MEPRLSGGERRRLELVHGGRPELDDTIEYCYIDGQEGVYQESRVGFNPDGIEFKARIDFGCAWVSHRGWVKNNGA